MKQFAEDLLKVMWAIKLGMILLILFIACNIKAQSVKTFGTTIDCKGLSQLHLNLGTNVIFKVTKSERLIIERTVTVKHSSKSDIIVAHIGYHGIGDIKTQHNYIEDTLFTSVLPYNKIIKVDNEAAVVSQSFVVYIPQHIKIVQ